MNKAPNILANVLIASALRVSRGCIGSGMQTHIHVVWTQKNCIHEQL